MRGKLILFLFLMPYNLINMKYVTSYVLVRFFDYSVLRLVPLF